MMNIETPRMFYKLYELDETWGKYGKSETDILHMAALGKATLHIWYKGTIMLKNFHKESIKSPNKKYFLLKPYDGLAQLPMEEAKKFLQKNSEYIRDLMDADGNSFIAHSSEKDFNEVHISDICMVPEEVKRLVQEFSRLQKEQSADQMADPDSITCDNTEKIQKRGGAPKSSLREIVEYAYNKLLSDSNIAPIRRGNINQFMIELQKMKRSALIASVCPAFDNIIEIKKSFGKWVIRTDEKVLKDTDKREIIEKSKNYETNDISKILTDLRKAKPLSK